MGCRTAPSSLQSHRYKFVRIQEELRRLTAPYLVNERSVDSLKAGTRHRIEQDSSRFVGEQRFTALSAIITAKRFPNTSGLKSVRASVRPPDEEGFFR